MTPLTGRVLSWDEIVFAREALLDDEAVDEIDALVMDSDGECQPIWVSDLVRTLEVRVPPIAEVYERYKRLEGSFMLLGSASAEPDDPIGKTCWALWAAVKRAMEGADA